MLSSWVSYVGKDIQDILGWVRDNRDGREVHIGTDSIQHSKKTQFVTVVVMYAPGKGGLVALQRETVLRIPSLHQRLQKETWKSIQLGMALQELGELTIHIDANQDPQHRSSDYVQELVGMVVGQGFNYRVKPEAWAASHAADHIVRTQGRYPRIA